jgi:hypothetical protein
MLRVKLITNGSLAIAFDVYLDGYYYAHIEYRKWNNEMRLEHRSGYWFVDETTFKAQQMALEQVTNITVEEEILCD